MMEKIRIGVFGVGRGMDIVRNFMLLGCEVVAICAGTTEIAAIAGGVKAACSVTVAEDGLRAASLMLSAGTLELTEGKTAALTATVLPTSIPQSSIVWTSSNEEAAVVDGGVVTARAAGAAIIRASVGGKTASCTVTVKAARVPVSSVTLDRSTLELSVDGTARLTATVRPENADDRTVVWQSSREDVATVSGGIVRGVAEGSALISATAGGAKAECSVTVSQALVWCSVVNRLSHVTTDQTAVVVAKGRAYKAALTAESGYTLTEVSVKMGSEDVTGSAWNAEESCVDIEAVTGNIVITAKAEVKE